MAKLILTTSAKNRMADKFIDAVNGYGSDYTPAIFLYRTDITSGADFNNGSMIDLVGSYPDDNLTINSVQNFKKLDLLRSSSNVTPGSAHVVSNSTPIGDYENAGTLVWAIPSFRNVHAVGIGAYNDEIGYLFANAFITLSSPIPPTTGNKTFLIDSFSIGFKGDGE